MPPRKVNLARAFDSFDEAFRPRIVGDVNDCQAKVVKVRGSFEWHRHEVEDELFLVLRGRLRVRFRDGDVELDEGELIVVPRGVEHLPEAIGDECQILLFEPATTLNTGTEETARTVRDLERL